MAVDGDESLLPKPPPPRPAARRAAVEAALRKFDGSDEPSIGSKERKRPLRGWKIMGRRPAGALVTAALIAVIGIPAAMIALRDQAIAPRADEPAVAQPEQNAAAETNSPPAAMQPPPAEQPVAAEPLNPSNPSASEPMPLAPVAKSTSPSEALEAFDQAPAPMAAPAAAPPPPPAPPPAPPAPQVAEESEANEIVLTGSRVARSDVWKQREKRERAASSASPLAIIDANGEFLSGLQSAVRANDRRAVARLVGLPLRVNFDAGPKTYSDRKSVERDYDRIFTPRVRQAILNQKADDLFMNYKGAMVGAGEVWFDASCANTSCSRRGRVRIRTVNP